MELRLYDMFDTNTLRDRETALIVLEKISQIPKDYPVKIDFTNIIFASRSFCHELLTGLKDKKNVSFKNMSREIRSMMSVSLKKPSVIQNNHSIKIVVIG